MVHKSRRLRSVTSKRRHCNMLLSRKVRKNIKEYQSRKRFYTAKQPIAVAYVQILKSHPECKRYYRKAGKILRRSRK